MANLNGVMDYTAEKLNDRVTILRSVVMTDSEGNRIREYGAYKTVWANVNAIGTMNTGESGTEVKRVINYSIVVRWQDGLINEMDRISWNGIVLKQTSPAVSIGRKFIVISAKDMRENG